MVSCWLEPLKLSKQAMHGFPLCTTESRARQQPPRPELNFLQDSSPTPLYTVSAYIKQRGVIYDAEQWTKTDLLCGDDS